MLPCSISLADSEEVFHILVGVQRMTIPHITAPACVPFLDQFRQIVISDKKLYKDATTRLCVLYSMELLVRQADCGAADVDPHAADATTSISSYSCAWMETRRRMSTACRRQCARRPRVAIGSCRQAWRADGRASGA